MASGGGPLSQWQGAASSTRRLPIRANFAILFAKEKVTEGARRMTELDKKLAKAARECSAVVLMVATSLTWLGPPSGTLLMVR